MAKRIRVQISNSGLAEKYKLQQLLINAVLDSEENSEETALASRRIEDLERKVET